MRHRGWGKERANWKKQSNMARCAAQGHENGRRKRGSGDPRDSRTPPQRANNARRGPRVWTGCGKTRCEGPIEVKNFPQRLKPNPFQSSCDGTAEAVPLQSGLILSFSAACGDRRYTQVVAYFHSRFPSGMTKQKGEERSKRMSKDDQLRVDCATGCVELAVTGIERISAK
jgi:hypothetical protein